MWSLIIIPILAVIISLLIKAGLLISRHQGNPWQVVWSYGGMPSMHAAFTTALCTSIFLYEGVSTALAVSVVFTFLIIMDSLRLRRFVGEQGRVLNKLIANLPQEQEYKYPILSTQVGHRLAEVIVGVIVGLIVGWLGWLIWWN